MTTGNGVHQTVQAVHGVVLHVADIQTEGELVNVSLQMFVAGMVIDAVQSALQDGPDALNTVRADIASYKFFRAMVDRLMLKEQPAQRVVAAMLISINLRPWLNVGVDHFVNGWPIRVFNWHRYRIATPFSDTKHGRLTDRAAPLPEFLMFVFIGFFPSDIGFIDFHDPAQHRQVIPAGFPKPLQHEPGRLLRDADFLGELQRGDALARSDQEIHGIEPFAERNVGPLEDGPRSYRKVLLTGVTAVKSVLPGRDPFLAFAAWTDDAILPQPRLQIRPGRILVRKHLEEFKRADRDFVHGQAPCLGAILSETAKGVKYIIPFQIRLPVPHYFR